MFFSLSFFLPFAFLPLLFVFSFLSLKEKVFFKMFRSYDSVVSLSAIQRILQQCALLGRVLRRVLEIAFKKVLRRALRRRLAVGFDEGSVLPDVGW